MSMQIATSICMQLRTVSGFLSLVHPFFFFFVESTARGSIWVVCGSRMRWRGLPHGGLRLPQGPSLLPHLGIRGGAPIYTRLCAAAVFSVRFSAFLSVFCVLFTLLFL